MKLKHHINGINATNEERVRLLLDDVCAEFNVEPNEVLGVSRKSAAVAARTKFVGHCIHKVGMSLNGVGAFMDRDHTGILYLQRRWDGRCHHCDRYHVGPKEFRCECTHPTTRSQAQRRTNQDVPAHT